MDLILLPIWMLQGASCYFVALIVLFRLMSVKNPMTFRTGLPTTSKYKKLSNIISVTIGLVLLLISLIGFILSFNSSYNKTPYIICKVSAFHIFFTLPILSTLIMYGVLLCALKQNADTISTQLRETKDFMAKLTKGVVICLIVCNMPYIIWAQYLAVKYPNGDFAANVFNTNFGVRNNV